MPTHEVLRHTGVKAKKCSCTSVHYDFLDKPACRRGRPNAEMGVVFKTLNSTPKLYHCLCLSILALIMACVPLDTGSSGGTTPAKRLHYDNRSYEAEIKTVRLFSVNRGTPDYQSPAIAPLGRNNLVLEFDDLVENQEAYYAKIIHCNADWRPSILRPLNYLFEFNEFPINQFEFSMDTRVPYVHYTFPLPQVKVPGNYLLVIYRNSDQSDIVLSRRFMIFSSFVGIQLSDNLLANQPLDRKGQRIDFNLFYQDNEILDPLETVSVMIRQNQRPDNAIRNLKPNFVREAQNVLEYRFFGTENVFAAGNEFRFFDLRSIRFPGQNVARVDLQKAEPWAYIMLDKPRGHQRYAEYNDLNGGYSIENLDQGNAQAGADYLNTTFTLSAEQPLAGEVYITGNLTDWNLNAFNRMKYDPDRRVYQKQMLLKQGWYDYQYLVKADTLSKNYIEGDYFETENMYEIFVYYRPLEFQADQLVGYRAFGIQR